MKPPQAGWSLRRGVVRLRSDDHFMILAETDASPMQLGALIRLERASGGAGLLSDIRRQVGERLAATPLLRRLVQAPDGFDSDVWAEVASCDLDYHVVPVALERADEAALNRFVARCSLERLDFSRPPFRIHVVEALEDGTSALYVKMHHAVADGVGFQAILEWLSDFAEPSPPRAADAVLPSPQAWRALAEARFQREAGVGEAFRQRRKAARVALDALEADPAERRAPTPTLKMSGPTSRARSYATASLSLDRVKALGRALGGTVNDVFLALAAEALRRHLIEVDDLPPTPLVANSARSCRRPEHAAFGNRIVALHPHLATHLADPLERLRAIQAEMARERRRTAHDEALLDAPEQPFGPRDRREKFARMHIGGAALLPGNVTLSNVPGPEQVLSYAGRRVIANNPTPILGSGRFLNITSRRNAERLDIGVMSDGAKIPDAGRIAAGLHRALETYEHAASVLA